MKRRRRNRGQRSIVRTVPVLPTIITLGNLGSGFGSIIMASQGKIEEACWLIFLGMVFDVFDGSVARLTNQTGKFGEEMDSLADVVTFGLAPAFLVKAYIWPTGEPKMAWIIGMLFLFCAAMRLARYNVESAPKATTYFFGLPTPAAAGALVSQVLVALEYQEYMPWLIAVMKVSFVVLAVVMVSRVRYAHLANTMLGGHKSITDVVQLLLLLVLLILYKEVAIAVIFNGYAVAGLVMTALGRPKLEAEGQNQASDNAATVVKERDA